MLTVQTNNATFGTSAQPAQQFAISKIRAVENGRSVVIAATTGISAVIAPDRSVLAIIEENDVGFRVVDVPLRSEMPPSATVGPWVEGGLIVLALIAFVVGIVVRRLGYLRG